VHSEAFAFARQVLAGLELPTIRALEIGARDFNGSVRTIINGMQPEWYVGIDTAPGPGVDAIGDGSDYTPLQTPNLVICTEVLEHTRYARDVVRNIGRVLEPGGFALITCATDPRRPRRPVHLDAAVRRLIVYLVILAGVLLGVAVLVWAYAVLTVQR
jgi:SAM-dependent methyltransferase